MLHLNKEFMDLASQLELKSYKEPLCVNRVEKNEHHQLGELVGEMDQELEEGWNNKVQYVTHRDGEPQSLGNASRHTDE